MKYFQFHRHVFNFQRHARKASKASCRHFKLLNHVRKTYLRCFDTIPAFAVAIFVRLRKYAREATLSTKTGPNNVTVDLNRNGYLQCTTASNTIQTKAHKSQVGKRGVPRVLFDFPWIIANLFRKIPATARKLFPFQTVSPEIV